jgi:ABC-type Fe3+/spermidine/putrescine transport system ATPase subunit
MLVIRDITKSYEGKPLLRGVSFDVSAGETVCLLGASGSGKSTLLRIIAGLEPAEGGQVLWDGTDLVDTPTHLRQFGLMFQDYALFPHRTVAQNVGFGLKMQGLPRAEMDRQARALAPRPRLLMLDEPLGALDRSLREQLIGELHELLHQTGIPAIYVTHDQEEAFALADRLILLHNGRVEQDGPPGQVYARPVSAWTARFLGLINLLPGTLRQVQPVQVETCLGLLQVANPPDFDAQPGDAVLVLVRPTAALPGTTSALNPAAARVQDVAFRGFGFRVVLACSGGQRLELLLSSPPKVGDIFQFSIQPQELLLLPPGDLP